MGLTHTVGRVVIMVDLESKNSHRFEDGTEIKLARGFNNFNRRESQPVNATVISADYIPEGSEILIGHNSLHETNKINDYKPLSGAEAASSVKYYSIPEEECFAYRGADGLMKPCKEFQFGLRVFKPYRGVIEGIEPELLNDVLYCTTGDLKGYVVQTLKAADYQIIFQSSKTGKEDSLIRFRHSDEEELVREEVALIRHDLTDLVNIGDLIVGLSISDAQPIEISAYAD